MGNRVGAATGDEPGKTTRLSTAGRRPLRGLLAASIRAGLQQVLMIPHAVGVPSDVDDMAVVDQPVDQSGGHHLVAEHAAPVLEALVRGQHGRGPLVSGVDELEEEHGAVLRRPILTPQYQATSIVYRADRRATHAPNNTSAPSPQPFGKNRRLCGQGLLAVGLPVPHARIIQANQVI